MKKFAIAISDANNSTDTLSLTFVEALNEIEAINDCDEIKSLQDDEFEGAKFYDEFYEEETTLDLIAATCRDYEIEFKIKEIK